MFYDIIHWHYYMDVFSIIYLCIAYFAYAVSKWSTISKCYLYVVVPSACCWCSNCYSSAHEYIDLNIEVLNLIWLLVLCAARESSFISKQFFVLNLVSWFDLLPKKFSIYHYHPIIIGLTLSINFYLSFGDIYPSLGDSLSFLFVTVFELFCCEFFETFLICLIFHYYTIILILSHQ